MSHIQLNPKEKETTSPEVKKEIKQAYIQCP